LDRAKGWGTIMGGNNESFFFHSSAAADPFDKMREGDDVTFDACNGPKGRRALNVRSI
jgi:CspA family cold shock protein